MTYTFTHAGKPERQQRPRFVRGRVWMPSRKAQSDLGRDIWAQMAQHGWNQTLRLVRLRIAFYGCGRSDLSTLVKLWEDAANKILWLDDRQVVDLKATIARKDPNPRTEVEVEEILLGD
jgi:Holliday junction resolvase RusA-like endonuclease